MSQNFHDKFGKRALSRWLDGTLKIVCDCVHGPGNMQGCRKEKVQPQIKMYCTYGSFASYSMLLTFGNYPMFSKHSLTSSAISAEPNFSETRPATERLQ